jgi:hypothetical protein
VLDADLGADCVEDDRSVGPGGHFHLLEVDHHFARRGRGVCLELDARALQQQATVGCSCTALFAVWKHAADALHALISMRHPYRATTLLSCSESQAPPRVPRPALYDFEWVRAPCTHAPELVQSTVAQGKVSCARARRPVCDRRH